MTGNTRKAAAPALIADDFLKVMVDQLIANLVCDEENVFDRVGDMPYPIQGQDLPQNMPFHQRVLDAVYDCSERPTSVYPTRANILMALGILYEMRGPTAETQLDAILAKRTRSGDVAGLSAYLWEAIENHRAQAIGAKFTQVLASGIGTSQERKETALAVLDGLVSVSAEAYTWSADEFFGTTLTQDLHDDYVRRVTGKPLGPTLKFRDLIGVFAPDGTQIKEGAVPNIAYGETTLITAFSGAGKTTLGQVLAEENAWFFNHDVFYIFLETPPKKMRYRAIARRLQIPLWYLAHGSFDPTDPQSVAAKQIDGFKKWVKRGEKVGPDGKPHPSGRLTYHYCPGWPVTRIIQVISHFRRMAEKRERPCLIVLDYYNIIPNESFTGRANDVLGQTALALRNAIQRENMHSPIHCILFAQQSEDKITGELYAYGSKEIIQYSQTHIAVVRTTATRDQYRPDGAKNFLDQPRLVHKAGRSDALTELHALKVNDGPGGIAKVVFEGPLGIIEDYQPAVNYP